MWPDADRPDEKTADNGCERCSCAGRRADRVSPSSSVIPISAIASNSASSAVRAFGDVPDEAHVPADAAPCCSSASVDMIATHWPSGGAAPNLVRRASCGPRRRASVCGDR